MAVGLNVTIFDNPTELPVWLLFYPSFNICRIYYILTISCGYSSCVGSAADASSELVRCIVILYASAVVYSALGIYFYEIIPQQYGIRKSPIFFLQACFRKKRKYGAPSFPMGKFGYFNSLENFDCEMNTNEEEVKHEVEKIKSYLNCDDRVSVVTQSSLPFSEYPLLVYGLSKIYEGADPTEAEKKVRKKALNNFSIMLEKNEIFGLLG